MITLNDQKKLAENYFYLKKCRNFYFLSLIFAGVLAIIIAPITSSYNLFCMPFLIMYLVLAFIRVVQLAEAKSGWN
ncbi:MAG: hypothetical protein V1825_02445 [Candidatus Falkowbacteria bacterium]|nr:hypothetical protein [Candidatus Parcubacteria bacterium]